MLGQIISHYRVVEKLGGGTDPVRLNPDVSTELQGIIGKAMDKERDERASALLMFYNDSVTEKVTKSRQHKDCYLGRNHNDLLQSRAQR